MPLAPHSASGFKGVLKVRDGCFQARVNIKGKGRCTVWTAPTAEEAAWVLQKWRNNPCGLSSPGKRCSHKRERWSRARASLASRFSARSQPSSVARRRDEEEGGMELMIARELQRVEERRVKQCVSVDRCPLSPVKKQ